MTSRTGQEGHGAVEVYSKAALDAAEDAAIDTLAFAELAFQLVPCGFAAGAVTAQHRFAIGVFDAIDENFDFAADGQAVLVFVAGKFLEGDAAFALEADIDHGQAVFNCSDSAFYDAAFKAFVACTAKLFVEKRFEIVARRVGRSRHRVSFLFTFATGRRFYRGLKLPPTHHCEG